MLGSENRVTVADWLSIYNLLSLSILSLRQPDTIHGNPNSKHAFTSHPLRRCSFAYARSVTHTPLSCFLYRNSQAFHQSASRSQPLTRSVTGLCFSISLSLLALSLSLRRPTSATTSPVIALIFTRKYCFSSVAFMPPHGFSFTWLCSSITMARQFWFYSLS